MLSGSPSRHTVEGDTERARRLLQRALGTDHGQRAGAVATTSLATSLSPKVVETRRSTCTPRAHG